MYKEGQFKCQNLYYRIVLGTTMTPGCGRRKQLADFDTETPVSRTSRVQSQQNGRWQTNGV